MSPNSQVGGGTILRIGVTWDGSVTNSGCTMPENNCPPDVLISGTCDGGYWVVGVFCSPLAASEIPSGDFSDCDMHNAIDLTDDNAGPNNIDSNTPSGQTGTSYDTCTTLVSLADIFGPLFGALPFNANCAADDAGTGGWADHWPLGHSSGTLTGPAPQTDTTTVFNPARPVQCPPDANDVANGATANTCDFVLFPVKLSSQCYNTHVVGTVCIPDTSQPDDGVTILNKDILSASFTYMTPPTPLPSAGYWLATAGGGVFNAGKAPALGHTSVPSSDPVVDIASTSDGRGYWLVTASGDVKAFGDAQVYGTLPGHGVTVSNITAIAPTGDNRGYWLIGRDGGEFAFGDAHFHGSLPGVGVHVDDIVGMVATANGGGYWIAGADGGVFAFGNAHFVGSLPSKGVVVDDIRTIVASPTRAGYMLAGADGGTFAFGTGLGFLGSLPGDGIHVDDIVGLALTPDKHGYWVAGSGGVTYSFGDAVNYAQPRGLNDDLPVVGIAST